MYPDSGRVALLILAVVGLVVVGRPRRRGQWLRDAKAHFGRTWGRWAAGVTIVLPIVLALSAVCTGESSTWHYLIQFGLGGWPEGFPEDDPWLLGLGVFLQGFFAVGVPVLVLSALKAFLGRRDIMRLPDYIDGRDQTFQALLTPALFAYIEGREVGEVPQNETDEERQDREERYSALEARVNAAFAYAKTEWERGQLKRTRTDWNGAMITVYGEHPQGAGASLED